MSKKTLLGNIGFVCTGVLILVAALHAHSTAAAEETPPLFTPIDSDSPLKNAKPEADEAPTPLDPPPGADVVELPLDPLPAKPLAPPLDAVTVQKLPKIDSALDEDVLKKKAGESKAGSTPTAGAGKNIPQPLKHVTPETTPDTRLVLPIKPLMEPGYASVLTGTLSANAELGAETLPHLIRGVLVIPAKMTLKINAGAIVHLRADANATRPLQAGAPDPTKSAALWIYGTLIIAGENGRPVEIAGLDKDNANVLFYGAEACKLDGARFKAVDVAQNGGICQWTNCEFNDSKYYALAAGAGQFTHCSFKKCGGIFAAYDEGPWGLLVRRCLFENCRDGLLLNRDPGPACLLIEKNNFIGTRGANLRAMPRPGAANAKSAEELLIGENWYGTTVEEEIDRRIVDRRTDPTIKAHLNTRPPSDKPFANAGAGALQSSINNTLNDQQGASAKMLAAVAAKQKAAMDKVKVAMEKTALSGKEVVKKDPRN